MSFSGKLGDIVSTWFSWKLFADSIGLAVLDSYQGTFELVVQLELKQAKVANKEVQGNRTANARDVILNIELYRRFLPKDKSKIGATSTKYVSCLL